MLLAAPLRITLTYRCLPTRLALQRVMEGGIDSGDDEDMGAFEEGAIMEEAGPSGVLMITAGGAAGGEGTPGPAAGSVASRSEEPGSLPAGGEPAQAGAEPMLLDEPPPAAQM